jgi:hypothetical protein
MDSAESVESLAIGQGEIQQDEIDRAIFQATEAVTEPVCPFKADRGVALLRQPRSDDGDVVLVIFDEQDLHRLFLSRVDSACLFLADNSPLHGVDTSGASFYVQIVMEYPKALM